MFASKKIGIAALALALASFYYYSSKIQHNQQEANAIQDLIWKHTLVFASERKYHLYGVGNNSKGQIGHCSIREFEQVFRLVPLPSTVSSQAQLCANACGLFSAVLANGKLLVAGDNIKVVMLFCANHAQGQQGIGSSFKKNVKFYFSHLDAKIKSVACGAEHMIALTCLK